MKVYDAKEQQTCLICGILFSHNKQGRFTSHIVHKHGLTLHDYLIQYYYGSDDLKCKAPGCGKQVKLRRGKPNQYCHGHNSIVDRKRVCEVCGSIFFYSSLHVRACSTICGRRLAAQSIKEWHANMGLEEKREHFKKIALKSGPTRRLMGITPWNKGKTGIYSTQTIERIRQAALKQYKEGAFKKTQIEQIMECILKNMRLNHTYSFVLEKRQYDFILHDYQTLIECDGDYWHANPKFYPEPTGWQKERVEIDKEKNEIASRNGYQILRFWEDDIMNHVDQVELRIASYLSQLATTKLETASVNA